MFPFLGPDSGAGQLAANPQYQQWLGNAQLGLDYTMNGPAGPDYMGLANQQSATQNQLLDKQTTANRPNQFTPLGSSEWTQGPDGQWSQNFMMNSGDQANLNASRQLSGGVMGAAQGLLGGPNIGNADQYRQRAEDAIYGRAASRLDPMWNQRESSMQQQLANQGLDMGSEAYKNAMGDFGRSRNDAYSSAMNDAITGGGQEASRMFGMDLSKFQAGLSGLGLAGNLAQGMRPGMPQMPGFMGAGAGQAPNLLGAGAAQDASNKASWQGRNDMITDTVGSVFGLGKSIIPFF